MKTSTFVATFAASVFGLFAVSVHAQVLMLDFGSTAATGANLTNSPYHTANTGFTGNAWNTLGTSDTSSGLVFSNNSAATGVSVNLGRNSTSGTVIDLASNPVSLLVGTATSTGVYTTDSVGRDGIFGTTTSAPRIGLQVGGLAAGTYDIYITARNTNTGSGQPAYSQYVFAGTSATATNFDYAGYSTASLTYPTGATSANTYTDAWNQNLNYVKLSVSITSGEFINIAIAGDGTDRGFLNSVQFVNTTSAVPEPSTYVAIAGLGALGVALIVRRHRAAR